MQQIARKSGYCFQTVVRKMNAFAIERREGGFKPKPLLKKTLRELYVDQQLSICKAAEKLKVSFSTARKYLNEYGIQIRQLEPKSINKQLLTDLYLNQKLTIKQIAGILKTSTMTVTASMKKHNIKSRPKGTRSAK